MIRCSRIVACLGLLGVLAVTNVAVADGGQVAPEAREHFQAGVAYLEEPTGAKYEDAYREFHAAYAVSPSYKILNNIALCSLFLERDGEAIDGYERYLASAAKGEIPPAKRTQIESDLQRLKAGLVVLQLKTVPTSVTVVDERQVSQGSNPVNRYTVTNGQVELGVHAGNHRITVMADGYQPQVWEFDAQPKTTHTKDVSLLPMSTAGTVPVAARTPIPASSPSRRAKGTDTSSWVYVGALATGIFAVSTAVSGVMVISKKNELVDLNKTGDEPGKAQELHDAAKRLSLVSDISLGAAVVAAGATAYFYFTSSGSSEPVPAVQAKINVLPAFGVNQAGLAVQGSF